MSAAVAIPLPDNFLETHGWLVQAVDPRARLARLIRMDRSAYREASFLDDRMLATARDTCLCDLDALIASASAISDPPAAWIFHIGHVGSTLVSRLLGEIEGVLAVREPRALRDLAAVAEEERPRMAAGISRLMARRGAADRCVIVKATSFVSEFAPLLVGSGAAALFLYANPKNYIASILAGENSVLELRALHEVRKTRLVVRGLEIGDFDRNNAFRAAQAWACEMTSLEAAADALDDSRILWADFDLMLGDMPSWLGRVAQHFRLSAGPGRIREIATGPLMRRYSKALEYDYSPSLRAELLAEAGGRHGREIDAAIGALRRAAETAPLLKRALDRAGSEC